MFKKLLPHIVAVVFFYLFSILFFLPDFQGKQLIQTDIISARGMNAETSQYRKETGKISYWTNGMFGGMPWQQLSAGKDKNATKLIRKMVDWSGQSRLSGTLFLGCLCSYFILVLLGVSPWLSIIGAFAFAYNTNYVILLEAGHLWKVDVLVVLPLIFGGSLLAFKGKPLLGALTFGVGCSLAIYSNHIQMLYYLSVLMVVFYALYILLKITLEKEQFKTFLKPIGFLALASVIALAAGSAQLYSAKQFSENTMRGEPILKQNDGKAATTSSEVDGLEWTYVNQWSNDWKDIMATFIPRIVGGSSSEEVPADSQMGQLMQQNGAPRGSDNTYSASMYWGDQPFTSGPYYYGILVLLFFVFALFQLSPAMRWSVLGAIFLGVLISLGKNASWLVRLMYDYLPLFNKFRAHSSMLSVLPVFMVITSFYGLHQALINENKKKVVKDIFMATGIVGGFCLLMGLIGSSLYSFLSEGDSRYPAQIQAIFIEQRQAFLRADAFRSFLLVLLGGGLIWASAKNYIKQTWVAIAGIGILVLFDMYSVNRRYLDADNYQVERNYEGLFNPRPVDQQIFQQEPKGRGYYRVLDLSINTFNDARTSVHHNTIGGYYAAKLQRFADIIDYHISQNNQAVLNMLNTKYIITQQQQLQANPGALGNAWFVNNIKTVQTAREEIDQLNGLNPGTTAIIKADEFQEQLAGFSAGDGSGSIELIDYAPNRLVYQANTSADQLAVFSEVWYGPNKGWTLTIDGEPTDILRANYILRAAKVPAGNHELVFEFKPNIPVLFSGLSVISSWLLLLAFLGLCIYRGYQWLQEPEPAPISKASTKPKVKKKAIKKKQAPKKKK
ncbi:MAG: YfhO family protein [Saprospiraceae bacterium]